MVWPMFGYDVPFVRPHTEKEMFRLPPKVLLYHEHNEGDVMRDRMINLVKKRLDNHHIEYTFELDHIETVQMSILFVNRSFVRNCAKLLDPLVKEIRRTNMWSTAVWYEDDESKIVRELITSPDYPNFSPDLSGEVGELEKKEYKQLGELVISFIKTINTNNDIVVKHREDIEKEMETMVKSVAKLLNPLGLDFSQIGDHLKSHTLDKCCALYHALYDRAVSRPVSPMVTILQGCPESCCQLNTVSKLLFTLVKQRSYGRFRCCVYLDLSKQSAVRRQHNSLFDLFVHELSSEYGPSFLSCRTICSMFVVIEGLRKFQAFDLASLVMRLNKGSLVIATCGEEITTAFRMHKGDPVQVTKCNRPRQGETQMPAYFTILDPIYYSLLESDDDDDDMDSDVPEEDEKGRDVRVDESERSTHKKPRTQFEQ